MGPPPQLSLVCVPHHSIFFSVLGIWKAHYWHFLDWCVEQNSCAFVHVHVLSPCGTNICTQTPLSYIIYFVYKRWSVCFFFVLLCLSDRYPHSNCPCISWGGHKAQCHFFLIIKRKLLEPSPPVSVTDNLALDTLWIFLNIQSKHSTHYKVIKSSKEGFFTQRCGSLLSSLWDSGCFLS